MEQYQNDKEFNNIAIDLHYISVNMLNDLKRCNDSEKITCENAIKCTTYTENAELKEIYSKRLIATKVIENSFKSFLREVKKYSSKWDNVKA